MPIDSGGGLGAEVAVPGVEIESTDAVFAANTLELYSTFDPIGGVVSHALIVVLCSEGRTHPGGLSKVMAHYKATNDHTVLGKVAEQPRTIYPSSVWASKAIPMAALIPLGRVGFLGFHDAQATRREARTTEMALWISSTTKTLKVIALRSHSRELLIRRARRYLGFRRPFRLAFIIAKCSMVQGQHSSSY